MPNSCAEKPSSAIRSPLYYASGGYACYDKAVRVDD